MMMLFYGPEKRWDFQCTKPRKRKNVFALIFLLLYSRLKFFASVATAAAATTTYAQWLWGWWLDSAWGRLRCDWHIGRLALPLGVICSVALTASAAQQNVTTNNTVNYVKDNNTVNAFSTSTALVGQAGYRPQTPLSPPAVTRVSDNVEPSPLLVGAINNASGSASTNPPVLTNSSQAVHRLRYATHSAGVYSSQLQHLDDEDDYIDLDSDAEEGTFAGSKKRNLTEKGSYIGSPCEFTCSNRLHHVFCDPTTSECTCEKLYPVVIGVSKGCAKPKKLGEQCFYAQTCSYSDPNSQCVQVHNNAKCDCVEGFHSVIHYKPTKKEFCTPDMANLGSDLPTLLGVTSGIAVLAGLICMVLHLFSKNKYPRHRGHFADTHLPPPILYSSDTGIPLTLQAQSGRPSSRSSLHSSGSIGSYANRRQSQNNYNGTAKGVVVSTSRTGSRRPSLASVHSSSSSIRSYSMHRFEKELQQKEMRHEMKHRLSQMQKNHSAHQLQQTPQQAMTNLMRPKPLINVVELPASQNLVRSVAPTPSPLTPNSTEELLPMVDETQEEFTSLFSTRPSASYSGPCTPFDAL